MNGSASRVNVAVPVYQGTSLVGETLESILAQSHSDLRVMISVDGNDVESAAACERFLADDRVRIVIQERQLGWAENLSWLIEASEGDFFCYWQQDDICEPIYLEKLLAALTEYPDAACAYSDLRWFGRSSHDVAMPDNVGFTQQRILRQIEAFDWVPLRGLVPADVLARVGRLNGLDGGRMFADFLWVLRLAAAGQLVRVPEVLYHKRDHADSASHSKSTDNPYTLEEAAMRLGLAMFEEAAPQFDEADHQRLAIVIAERLAVPRERRWSRLGSLSPEEAAAFVADFFAALAERSSVVAPMTRADATEERFLKVLSQRAGAIGRGPTVPAGEDAQAQVERRRLVLSARQRPELFIACDEGGPTDAVLLEGWSVPDSWGTWNDRTDARLWLPIPGDGDRWTVRIAGQPFLGPSEAPITPRIVVEQGGRTILGDATIVDGSVPEFELRAADGNDDGIILRLGFPDAVSLESMGMGADKRPLRLGITLIELRRASADG